MSDDLKIIKQKLLNENRVQDILEMMNCFHITYSGGRIEAQLPPQFNSNNKRAVQIRLTESLSSYIRNRGDFTGGDIFSLVSFIHHGKRGDDIQKDLFEAKKFVCETLGWLEFLDGNNFKTKKDYVAPLKALMGNAYRKREIIPNHVLPENVMDQFYINRNPIPFDGWVKEGIGYNTQVMYGVGFDWDSHRIVFPLRNRFGQVVGVKGRIMKDEDSDKKYMYLYRCNNRYEWFNFHFAHPYIIEEKRVYILEAEKSPMKLFEHGIYNALAIGASDMSMEQVDIVKSLGLDIEIVLCYDKGITLDEIKTQAEWYKGRKIYAMYDIDNLLEGKNSPIDQGIETWNRLVEDYIFPINFDESID